MRTLPAIKNLLLPAPQRQCSGLFVDPAYQPPKVPPAQLSPSQRFAACLLQAQATGQSAS